MNYINVMNNSILPFFQALDWQNLMRSEQAINLPITLSLLDWKEPLSLDEIIRIVPGKRLVAFGMLGNRPIVAKLFYAAGNAQSHAKRDLLGTEALIAASIPTPKIFFTGTDVSKQIHILVYEKIVDAESLDTIWHTDHNNAHFASIMHAMTIELATQHVLGIVQHDLHFKNFLLAHHHIYTLDGGSITNANHPLEKKISLQNLALFFAQMGIGQSALQQELYKTYIQSRGWLDREKDYLYLQSTAHQYLNLRWKNLAKKVFRNSSAFAYLKTTTSSVMYDRHYYSAHFLKILQDPEKLFSDPKTRILKAGRTSTVAKINVDGHSLVLKRYNIKGFWHGLRRAFRPTRAATAWQLSQCLRLLGIPTAKPVAFIENRFLGCRGKSYFLMEYIEGRHAGEYFSTDHTDHSHFKTVACRIVKLIENLATLSLTHGDLKMTNILIKHHMPILIDLDGMKKHITQAGFKRAYANELTRLLSNWNNKPMVQRLFEEILHS